EQQHRPGDRGHRTPAHDPSLGNSLILVDTARVGVTQSGVTQSRAVGWAGDHRTADPADCVPTPPRSGDAPPRSAPGRRAPGAAPANPPSPIRPNRAPNGMASHTNGVTSPPYVESRRGARTTR